MIPENSGAQLWSKKFAKFEAEAGSATPLAASGGGRRPMEA